ncbi:hypothetical protein [Arthrobacter sp. SLBN-53]|uniref:hypothetical protein n=1 Tax=Arthrobacter sp. SLBN-53 TaxID=2768412 RepID=UPI0011532915|nr:hypothetical protein [Arthrobacter sp. SLBN-53]TQK31204.1 hypothetical protein FBY28_4234 [Arthrobacter sp. SLBN-53]
MRPIEDWPSLSPEYDLADELFGATGRRHVSAWLAEELARTCDEAFARSFSDHIDLPGVSSSDYLQRVIRTERGDLLGGIRFRGRNIDRPFVEIIAHTFDDVDDLARCVAAEWSEFAPKALRLRTRPGVLAGPGIVVDQTVHAARCRDLGEPDHRIGLTPFARAEDAVDLVQTRYRTLIPSLAQNVTAADAEDLHAWHAAGQLHAITVADMAVGVFAVRPGRIYWIPGAEIHEEVVDTAHAGNHYASHAQRRWAADISADVDEYLIGTIDGLNIASRRTAEYAGRKRVLDLAFIALTPIRKSG